MPKLALSQQKLKDFPIIPVIKLVNILTIIIKLLVYLYIIYNIYMYIFILISYFHFLLHYIRHHLN